MSNLKNKLVQLMVGVLGILILGGTPALGQAAGINFTNQLNGPVIVQGASLVNGVLVKGQPLVIFPGKSAYDANLIKGLRHITIYDANRPNFILLKKSVPFAGFDMQLFVRPIPPNPTTPFRIDLFPPSPP